MSKIIKAIKKILGRKPKEEKEKMTGKLKLDGNGNLVPVDTVVETQDKQEPKKPEMLNIKTPEPKVEETFPEEIINVQEQKIDYKKLYEESLLQTRQVESPIEQQIEKLIKIVFQNETTLDVVLHSEEEYNSTLKLIFNSIEQHQILVLGNRYYNPRTIWYVE